MSLNWRHWAAERGRKRARQHCAPGPLRDYLDTPLVTPDQRFIDTEFLVLDFETTGLEIEQDKALTVVYTVIRQGRVNMADNAHFYISHEEEIPESSVVIHGITETTAKEGEPLERVLEELLVQMRGRVLVAHYANIERNFIKKLVLEAYQSKIPLQIIDTLAVEYRRRQRLSPDVATNSLRLFNLRDEYRLPRYQAHNALIDAIATAELLLLQACRMSTRLDFKISEMMR